MTREYFLTTGAKFEGTEEEFEAKKPHCLGRSCPITDEDGYFSKWSCIVDWEICDKQCNKHRKPINEDIREFFEATCERYRK
jgi:hypothetical protein